jgi:hypothetical protein
MSEKRNIKYDVKRAPLIDNELSIFDELIKDIDIKEIPPKYIDRMFIQYHNGVIVELSEIDIAHTVKILKSHDYDLSDSPFKRMRGIKVFINTEKLAHDVNKEIEGLLGNHG